MNTTVDIIRDKVQELEKRNFGDDETPPKFIVSELDDAFIVILTVIHNRQYYSHGIEFDTNIEELMQDLYNQTM